MANSNLVLYDRALQYAKLNEIELTAEGKFGFGTDGAVWKTTRHSALKVFEHAKPYQNERASYQRLQERSITEISGLSVPWLVDFDNSIMAVEMNIVQPPYLLDFGKVYFDRPPPYWSDPQIVDTVHAEGRENV